MDQAFVFEYGKGCIVPLRSKDPYLLSPPKHLDVI